MSILCRIDAATIVTTLDSGQPHPRPSLQTRPHAGRVVTRGLSVDVAAIRAVLTAYVLTRLVIFFLIFVSLGTIPVQRNVGYFHGRLYQVTPHNAVLTGLMRFDSEWYYWIVTHGYKPTVHYYDQHIPSTVFFPLYPLLVKGLSALIGNIFVAGALISNAALLAALAYLYALVHREFDRAAAARAVLYVAAAPAAVFLSAMYTESLFILLVAATFYHARQGQWIRAALLGALGAATRNTGIFLALVVALEGLHQQGVRWRPPAWTPAALRAHPRQQAALVTASLPKLRPSLLAAAFVPVGLLAFMVYLARTVGDPLAFMHGGEAWGLDRFWLLHPRAMVVRWYHELKVGPHLWAGQIDDAVLIDLLITLAFVPLVVAVLRKMRPAHGVYTLLTFVTPLSTATLASTSMLRYVLMLVPCYMLLASWGRREWVHTLILVLSLPLMAYITVTFSHWYLPF